MRMNPLHFALGISGLLFALAAGAQQAAPHPVSGIRSADETGRLLKAMEDVPISKQDLDECTRREQEARQQVATRPPAAPSANSQQGSLDQVRGQISGVLAGKLPSLGSLFGKPADPAPAVYREGSTLDECVVNAKLRTKAGMPPHPPEATQAGAATAVANAGVNPFQGEGPKRLLTLEQARTEPRSSQEIISRGMQVTPDDRFVFHPIGLKDDYRFVIEGGYVFSFTKMPENPNCYHTGAGGTGMHLRVGDTVEETATCPRPKDTQRMLAAQNDKPLPVAAASLDPSIPAGKPADGNAGGNPGQFARLPTPMGDGFLQLSYAGDVLSHRYGTMPVPVSFVSVSIQLQLLDQALGPNDSVSLSSRAKADHAIVKSMVVSVGTRSYDFNNPRDTVELILKTDAARRIVGWRVRASLAHDNGNEYIHLFGPGFEDDQERYAAIIGGNPAGTDCKESATDIVFSRNGTSVGYQGEESTRYLIQSCHPGRWQLL